MEVHHQPSRITAIYEEQMTMTPLVHRQTIAPPAPPSQSVKPVWLEYSGEEEKELQQVPRVLALQDEQWQQKKV